MHIWRWTLCGFETVLGFAPREELRFLARFVSRTGPRAPVRCTGCAVAALKVAKEELREAMRWRAPRAGLCDTWDAATFASRGLTWWSPRLACTVDMDTEDSEDAELVPGPRGAAKGQLDTDADGSALKGTAVCRLRVTYCVAPQSQRCI